MYDLLTHPCLNLCLREGCAFVVILKSSYIVGLVAVKRTDKETLEELSVEVGIKEGLSSVSPR